MREKKVSMVGTIAIAAVTFSLIAMAIIFNISLVFAFSAASLFTLVILLRNGYDPKELGRSVLEGIKECRSLFAVILMMGATVSTWLASGVVPNIVYYAFSYVQPFNFIVLAFLFTLILAYVMGTAVGTISTIGLAMVAIGNGFMLPTHVTLGAVISGAFIADKIAPISSLNNLTLGITESSYLDYIKAAIKTLLPTILLSTVIYYLIGKVYVSSGDMSKVHEYQTLIQNSMVTSPYLLLFPILVIILAFYGVKTIYNMSIGVALAALVGIFVQKISPAVLIKSILWGYESQTGMAELDALVSGGGLMRMVEIVFIITGSVALSCLFEKGNLLKPLLNHLFKDEDSRFALIAKTGLLSALITTATCDQTAGIIIPVKTTKDKFAERNIEPAVLARTVADTGTVIAPLMPWNVNAIIVNSILGISALQYAPFAVLCFINPLVMILVEYVISLKRKNLSMEASRS